MNRKFLLNLDLGLLTPVIILVSVSLATLFSVNIELFRSQVLFLAISLFAFFIFSHINYKILHFYSAPIYFASLFFLFIVLILGFESHGAVRWMEIFGFTIQFSEIIKPFLVLSLASFLAQRSLSFKTFGYIILLLLPIVLFIYKQPDLGNAIIFAWVTLFTIIAFGFPFRWIMVGFIGFLPLLPVIWRFLHDYQRKRVVTFFNPAHDPFGASYNVIQSVIAVGSGSVFGKGLSQGTQSSLRFLPERHTDFIFATISEDLGFVGSMIILICFAFLLYRIYKIFLFSEDKFLKAFCIGAFFLILIQFFINVGMNIGILPIVGVTLPFVSYGGSSLLSNFILLGLLSSISTTIKKENVLEIR